MRREVFLGYSINKTTKIFSYSRYNDYEKKFYTGFRFDKKIYFTDKISLNNQFRYLTSPADQSDSDIGIYIPDLLYNLKNFSIGLRAFLVNRIESLDKIKMTKPYVGPAMIMKEEKFITMVTFLPDVNQHSEDYLFMALFIFKLWEATLPKSYPYLYFCQYLLVFIFPFFSYSSMLNSSD